MVEEHTHEGEALNLIGGNLCLDFTNTVNWRGGLDREEALTSYAALVAWGRRAGILTGDGAARLLSEAARRPADATAALERAIALRETIRRVVLAASEGRPPEAGDLDTLNGALAAALRRRGLSRRQTGLRGAGGTTRQPSTGCSGRCCVRRRTCSPPATWTGCGSAPATIAAGCSST
ncbi:MAG: ABATE domain-containing protein [Anaerolineae bacterium]|nr:ABATE domain-containing protein [Anaerolineae bacterium]